MTDPLAAEMPVLMDLVNGFEKAAIILGAVQLDVFSPLSKGPATAAAVASQLSLPERGVARVLKACAALGFVSKEGEHYQNAPIAAAFLVKDKPAYVGNMLKQASDRYTAWGKLAEAVSTDKPVLALTGAELFHAEPEVLDNYVNGLFELGKGMAQRIVSLVDLGSSQSLLDIAGGSGVYSIALCRQFPQLRATVFDLPPILERTQKIIEREGMAGRVAVKPGDYFKDGFDSGVDVILLSNMLQTEGRQTCRMVLQKAFTALKPGGRLLIHGIMPNADGVSPLQPVQFSLFMMLVFPEGEGYSGDEILGWLQEVGFVEGQATTLPQPAFTSLISAKKPD